MSKVLKHHGVIAIKSKYDEPLNDAKSAEIYGETIELRGTWIVWGNSGNGKTRYCLGLARQLAMLKKVAYWSLEEKLKTSFVRAVRGSNMQDVATNIRFPQWKNEAEFRNALKSSKTPRIIFIDSYQYLGLTKREYISLKEEFPNHLFVFVSHAEGKHPEGRAAKFVRYDADMKIRVEGYKAFIVSRHGGSPDAEYVIWPEGAAKYWGVGQDFKWMDKAKKWLTEQVVDGNIEEEEAEHLCSLMDMTKEIA